MPCIFYNNNYLVHLGPDILAIEVKAGKTGTLRSLRQFMDEHRSKLGIRFSTQPISLHDRILSIPIYAVSQWQRLAEEALKRI